jgi:pSer/pThr/pTyr-binding forkhead associated (FHA) protein
MSMPKLIISLDEKVVEEIPIEKEIITIGRRTDNDLCLDNLAISGYHSQISTVLDDCFLEDLESTNGTFVNSEIVKKHALKDGDIIDIGNHRIKYVNHLASSSANGEFEKTLILSATTERKNSLKEEQNIKELEDHIDAIENETEELDTSKVDNKDRGGKIEKWMSIAQEERRKAERRQVDLPHEERREAERRQTEGTAQTINDADDIQINSQSASTKIGRIQILNGKNSGKEISLDKSLTTVGKPDVAVVGITKRDSGYFIIHVDGNEKTPSKLNGEVIAGRAVPIEDHDIIDVAGIKLEFFVE